MKDIVGLKLYLLNEKGKRTLEKWEIISVNGAEVRLKNKAGRKLRTTISRVVLPEGIKPKKEIKMAKKKGVPSFDVKALAKEKGGKLLVKEELKFDHKDYKVNAYVLIQDKVYSNLNTYKYPDGNVSLGKNGSGITDYPLKGHKLSYVVSQTAKKIESRGEKRVRKGTKTAEEIEKAYIKKGYKKVKI